MLKQSSPSAADGATMAKDGTQESTIVDSTSNAASESASRSPEKALNDTNVATYSPQRRSRRRSQGHRSRESRLRLLKLALGFLGAMFFLTVLFMSGYLASLAGENDSLISELHRSERQVDRLQAELQQVSAQRDLLVQDRIPDLRPLEYDQAIAVDQGYIRNVIFTLARNGEETRHEYRIVLHNDSLSVVQPEVKIVLFDEVGVQIGLASLDRATVSTETDRTLLDPGEVRSYSGTISMLGHKPPHYFLISDE